MNRQHRLYPQTFPARMALSMIACSIASAYGAEVTDLGTVGTQATQNRTVVPSKAAAVAPAQASLDATQPQATINHDFFEAAKAPTADFTNIAAIAPGVSGGVSPNGPGLGEAKNVIRGFKDGEYNVTWDGIPFGDTNGPTHHSTAYFPASIIDQITVERGPGNASNLGQATFGGSVNLFSLLPASERTLAPYAAFGSWNTYLYGVRLDSGSLSALDDARITLNVQDMHSDGYRTYSDVDSKNFLGKFQKALGESTVLTVVLNYNRNNYNQPDKDNGLTALQASTLGKNYVLSNDPSKANYYKYNQTDKDTVMNYARLQSDLGAGWAIDNNTYYYNYTNYTLASDNGNNPTSGLGSVKTVSQATLANQMPGYIKLNEYWVAGNIFKATKQMESGLLRAGLWLEKADTHRGSYDINLLNMSPNYKEAAIAGVSRDIKYEQKSGWNQYQPFVEFEWAATQHLTITPGLKYMHTSLNVDASVNQTARIAQNVTNDFSATLPFLTANYKFNPVTSVYAQYAKGMLVPDISNYQSANAAATKVDPQTSTNYQFGVVNKSERITTDADVYYIDFNNKIAQDPNSSSSSPIYFNQGGVVYKGVEGQITYAFDHGFSIYGNGSINSAKSKATGLSIALAPTSTAALGLLYHAGDWTGMLVYKYVGSQYADDTDLLKVDAYTTTDLSVGYTLRNPGMGTKKMKLNLGIYNLFNKQNIVTAKMSGATPSASDTFLFQPERSLMASLKAEF